MNRALSEVQVQQFHQDGYLPPFPAMTASRALELRARLEQFEANHGGPLKGSNRFKSHLLFKWLSDLIREPALLDPVEDLIGPDIMVWATDWWIKEARSPSFVSWHQDSQYWGLDTEKLVTAWIALSPSTVESGCMRVMPGSHIGPALPHAQTFHNDNMLTRGQTISRGVDESLAVNLEVPTGHAILFAFRIAHASHPNTSDDRRIGIAVRYISPDARQTLAARDSASLVRGNDSFGHFEHEPVPVSDLDPVAVAFHRRSEEERRRILYAGTDWDRHRT